MIFDAAKIEWNGRKAQFHLVSTPRQGEVTLLVVPAKQSNQSLPHGEVTLLTCIVGKLVQHSTPRMWR